MRTFSASKFMICFFLVLGLGVQSLAMVHTIVWDKQKVMDPSLTLQLAKEFKVNDVLEIINPQTLTLNQVRTQDAYDHCIIKSNDLVSRQLVITFKFTYPGYYYFTGAEIGCLTGEKFQIYVEPKEAPEGRGS